MSKTEKTHIQKVLDFCQKKENKGMLFIVGNPIEDEMIVSFNGKTSYVKFPEMKDKKDNILVQIMNKSTFKEAMNEVLTGIVRATGVEPEDGAQMYHVIGGSLDKMATKVKKVNTN